ncbi:MAG: hypothetical protein IT368_08580, partial [Candidatus Hydrogenedentes bacterium]|nr:hypothetical protein [Candidatus Hydrogenedentota bacterium]
AGLLANIAALADIGFMWVSPAGFFATWGLGYGLSLLCPAEAAGRIWTWSAVMAEAHTQTACAAEGSAQ